MCSSYCLYVHCVCVNVAGPGWRAEIHPANHPISDYEFDVLIGADGRRSTLDGERQVLVLSTTRDIR